MGSLYQNLQEKFGSRIQFNVPMSYYTTLKIGGPAKAFFIAKTEEELIDILKFCQKERIDFLVIGEGSNLLVSDEGVDKLVIRNEVSALEQKSDAVFAKSGTNLHSLVNFTIEHGLSGLQKLAGIPGNVGGAIYGNAGAYGQTISDSLTAVTCFDPKTDQTITLTKDGCQFTYRDSGFKRNGLIILGAEFKLTEADQKMLSDETKDILQKRLAKYKPGVLCPGSFFKNVFMNALPPRVQAAIPKDRDYFGKVPAWYFLNEVGAKGDQLGQIKIADFHGNLFTNLGEGKALDFYQLAKKYHQKVQEKFDVSLEPEVQLVNLPPLDQDMV